MALPACSGCRSPHPWTLASPPQQWYLHKLLLCSRRLLRQVLVLLQQPVVLASLEPDAQLLQLPLLLCTRLLPWLSCRLLAFVGTLWPYGQPRPLLCPPPPWPCAPLPLWLGAEPLHVQCAPLPEQLFASFQPLYALQLLWPFGHALLAPFSPPLPHVPWPCALPPLYSFCRLHPQIRGWPPRHPHHPQRQLQLPIALLPWHHCRPPVPPDPRGPWHHRFLQKSRLPCHPPLHPPGRLHPLLDDQPLLGSSLPRALHLASFLPHALRALSLPLPFARNGPPGGSPRCWLLQPQADLGLQLRPPSRCVT
mmetsp:Transcript_43460/g.125460  ORF Transcript_43460/g.125460 Transcript_43460/m.125460 type:complete len:308 (+) Transcript_43460:1867-2790(+)